MNINFEELLSLPELIINRVTIEKNEIHISCQSNLKAAICPSCHTQNETINQTDERTIRDLPIIGKKVFIYLQTRQFVCSKCRKYYHEQFTFVDKKESVTNRYATSIFKLCNGIELQPIVVNEDLCWQTVNRIYQKQARKHIISQNSGKPITRIGIDEIALKKGHGDYVAVIVNLDTGEVIDMLRERTQSFIISYFQEKGEQFCKQIKLFCSDLWEGYLSAAKELFTNATIVTDRFHFFAKLQKLVDNCRRHLRVKFNENEELKNLRWILLKNKENLNEKERCLLRAIFIKPEYKLLKDTYELKNKFRDILEKDLNIKEAEEQIDNWIKEIENNQFLKEFKYFYQRHKEYILNYFKGKYHTSIIEGINNKIKSIKRRAFGFENFDFFRVRVICAFMV